MATTKTKKVTKKRDYLTLHAFAYILTWQTLYRTLNVVDLHIFFYHCGLVFSCQKLQLNIFICCFFPFDCFFFCQCNACMLRNLYFRQVGFC